MTEEKVKDLIFRLVDDGYVSREMLHYPSDIKAIIDELEKNGLR
jgi:DNA-binding MarR family transcriptional regulator